MRTYYIIVVGVLLIVFAMLFFPTLHFLISNTTYGIAGSTDFSNFLPLTQAATIILPYAFLGIAVYVIIKLGKR